jgi:hypothetical protein
MIDGVGATYYDISQYQLNQANSVATDEGKEDSGENLVVEEASGAEKEKDAKDKTENIEETNSNGEELTPEELEVVDDLKDRDAEVKLHESQHMSAGGSLVSGGMRLEYATGPDGGKYAVGGEVSIDISSGSTPEETVSKMQQVKAAALAPAEPSGQDMAVAAQATQMEMDALREITSKKAEELDTDNRKDDDKRVKDKKDTDKIEDNINDNKNSKSKAYNPYAPGINVYA